MIEFWQQLRAGRVDRSRWPVALQHAMVGTTWFDKWLYQAIYWYLIEQIAERLKSGELRNPKIYEFNPDILYDPKRKKSNKTQSNERTKTIPANGATRKKTSPNCRTISDEHKPLFSSDQNRLPRPSYAPTSSSQRPERLFIRLNLRLQQSSTKNQAPRT